jgi:hypothetical protein
MQKAKHLASGANGKVAVRVHTVHTVTYWNYVQTTAIEVSSWPTWKLGSTGVRASRIDSAEPPISTADVTQAKVHTAPKK